MKPTTFQAFMENTKSKVVHIGIRGISGHGGYSAGQIEIVTERKNIEMKDGYIIINKLHYREEHRTVEDRSKLSIGVGSSKLNTAYIDYEDILYGGAE